MAWHGMAWCAAFGPLCRYDVRMLGTEKEAALLQEAPGPKGANFFKDLSLECSKYA